MELSARTKLWGGIGLAALVVLLLLLSVALLMFRGNNQKFGVLEQRARKNGAAREGGREERVLG